MTSRRSPLSGLNKMKRRQIQQARRRDAKRVLNLESLEPRRLLAVDLLEIIPNVSDATQI